MALLKCESEGGRYPARLVRARQATRADLFSLTPSYDDGILVVESIADDVERLIVSSDLVALEQRTSYTIVEFDGEVTSFDSLADLNRWLGLR